MSEMNRTSGSGTKCTPSSFGPHTPTINFPALVSPLFPHLSFSLISNMSERSGRRK